MKQNRERPLSESVRTLRWAIVIGIFLVVVTYQFLRELALDFGATEGLTYGILLYGCVGSLVTWVALTWVSSRIAEGERAKQKVREEETYIASVVSASADAILTLSPEGVITSWNSGAELIFGYREEEIVGQHYSKLIPWDILDGGEVDRLATECEEKGYVRNLETERITKDGRRIAVEVTHTALTGDQGNVKGYSKIVRDITARKEAEEQQRLVYERIVEAEREIRQMNLELETRIAQRTENLEVAYQELQKANEELRRVNDQLQELDRMKSEFVSMVSHALRAPVTNINVAIEVLARAEAHDDDDERKELFQIIQAQSARLTGLVQGVLSISRLEGGSLELKREAVDMQALCEKTLQNFEATTESHLLRLSCLTHMPYAWADVDCTEEVLINLIGNAIKYSPAGGHIEVALEERGGCVVTSVTDQGPGIESNELDRIFEIFHRVDGSDSGATGGYGLGLYISKRLIEAQGGTIEAKSTVGKGSTMSFALPMAKEASSSRRGYGTT
jgi:PAS domain S-box-containing protein